MHFEDTPMHYERMRKLEHLHGFPPVSWLYPHVRKEIDKLSTLSYYTYAVDIIEPLMRRHDPIPATAVWKAAQEENLDIGWAVAHLKMEYMTYQFQGEGKQIFRVMPNLAEMLMETDLDVDTDLLRMPYRCFYIEVPPGLVEIYNTLTGLHKCEGIYVCEDPWSDEEAFIRAGRSDKHISDVNPSLIPNRVLRVLVIGSGTKKNADGSPDRDDDALFHFRIDLGPGKLNEYITGSADIGKALRTSSPYASVRENPDLDSIPDIFRFIANVILYINSTAVDMTQLPPLKFNEEMAKAKRLGRPKQKARAYERAQKHSGLVRIVLGASVGPMEGTPPGYHGKLSSRFLVRGHWRYYDPDNPRWKAAAGKVKWIKPFWKGPEMADVVDRRYQVGGQ